MSEAEILDVSREAVFVLIKMGAPAMLIALAIGLTVAIFQALTQIQEITLTFVPKILGLFVTVMLFVPYMLSTLRHFTHGLIERIVGLG